MKASIEQIKPPMRVLITEPADRADDVPILLYLHGKGEASQYENELPRICNHLSPPFQAMLGRLTDVIVVAPQAPHHPEDDWNWRGYTADLCRFLTARFGQKRILATGFSRGGLGVLQLLQECQNLISKWAIVDPQRAADDAEENRLLPEPHPDARGWLRYGEGIPKNKPFSDRLKNHLLKGNAEFVGLGHGDLALAAYKGERLDGAQSLYEFLDLKYK